MLFGSYRGIAQNNENIPPVNSANFINAFCFDGQIDQMDIKDLQEMYLEKTNEYFNQKIKDVLQDERDEAPTPNLDEYDKLGGNLCTSSGDSDLTCKSIAVCNPNKQVDENQDYANHPYCVGVTLLGLPPAKFDHYNYQRLQEIEQLKYSYFCYYSALNLKRDAIYDGTPQGILDKCNTDNPFKNEKVCTLQSQISQENDSEKKEELKGQLNQELTKQMVGYGYMDDDTPDPGNSIISYMNYTANRINFIDDEIEKAKLALDQTLDAYSQLKTSWQLHIRYIDIFNNLVKYRDQLVNIRQQTDVFPMKFVDATTTRCL